MAENKKAFLLYADIIHTVRKLPKPKQALLFMSILEYVNDENPVVSDPIVDIVFEPIKQQLKRDLVKYEKKKEQWSTAGKKSAEARKSVQRNPTDVNECSTETNNRSTDSTVNDSVNVNDTVNVTVINNIKEKEGGNANEKIFGEIAFAQQQTCKLFSISEINNGRTFLEVGRYLLRINEAGKIDYYLTQLKNYFELKRLNNQNICNVSTWLHGGSFNIDDGHWCKADYNPRLVKSNQQAKPSAIHNLSSIVKNLKDQNV